MSISTEQYTLEFRDEAIQQRRVKPYLGASRPKVFFSLKIVTGSSEKRFGEEGLVASL